MVCAGVVAVTIFCHIRSTHEADVARSKVRRNTHGYRLPMSPQGVLSLPMSPQGVLSTVGPTLGCPQARLLVPPDSGLAASGAEGLTDLPVINIK